MIDINAIVEHDDVQNIISSDEFYFQKGQDALKQWQELEVSDALRNKLVRLGNEYRKFQDEATTDSELNTILELLYTIIAYCDLHAKNKNIYNEYEDKRVLAKASVRMYAWVSHLILLKSSPESLPIGSTKNAFDYFLTPQDNTTILSEGHRQLISRNLFKKPFDKQSFTDDLKNFFSDYHLTTKNPLNYTHLLSRIIYNIQNEWKEEAVALMASDGTGWQDDYIDEMEGFDACIIWNSKRPSGTAKTIEILRKIVEDNSSFYLYYCVGGMVHYRALIIDFVENQKELGEKKWDNVYDILHYHNVFSNYNGDNKKASIVFLAQTVEKIKPISIKQFELVSGFDYPRQDNISPIKKEPENVEIIEENTSKREKITNSKMKQYPLNQILFGPPGTGKTYNTINKALEILNENIEGKTRKDIKELFDQKVKEGQIVFTTFHQSMSYEDFIEGIKPLEPKNEGQPVTYKVVDGIFKEIVKKADENYNLSSFQSSETNKAIPFDIAFNMLIEKIENTKLEYSETNETSKKGFPIKLQTTTFSIIDIIGSSIRMRISTGGEQNTMTQGTLKLIFEDSDNTEKYVKGGMKGYYKALVGEMKSWENDIKELSKTVQPLNYVLIIDEINRGNVSQIFGELITLIEEDKRLGKDEALEVTLPYSKTSFGVPPNLYIIGTMNTADRSVEALDTALRRRFSFEEMPPKPELLTPERKIWELWWQYPKLPWNEEPFKTKEKRLYELLGLEDSNLGDKDTLWNDMKEEGQNETQIKKIEVKDKANGINLETLLKTINNRIELLLDRDHQIGHSYFMSVGSIEDLKLAFHNKIIPLLQEYFFGDYGKIGLVLGEGFFAKKESTHEKIFAEFKRYDSDSFTEKEIYHLKNVKNTSDDEFIAAINTLMNKLNNEQKA